MTDWWIWVPVVEAVWILGVVLWILFERRSPASTVAWILALSFLPIVGVAVYLLFGPRRFRRKKLRHEAAHEVAARAGVNVADRAEAEGEVVPLIAQSEAALGPVARPRRARVELFVDGQTLFAELAAAIEEARDHVHLEYYIWAADRLGTRLRDLLAARASAGVEVRVLVDGLGSGRTGERFWEPLRAAGGHVVHFNPLGLWRLRPWLANFRTHRKIVIVDGSVAFTGGMNVVEDQTSEFSGEQSWRDAHLRIEGTAVRGLQMVFAEDWYFETSEELDPARSYPGQGPEGDGLVQVVSSGPDEDTDAIHKLYVASIASARSRVLLTTPYFVPDPSLLDALSIAALRGVDVRVMVPAENDHPFVAAASRSYYCELVKAGVRLFEYGPPMLHAKTLVVDERVAVVGTANADARSFRLNFEVVVATYEAATSAELVRQFHLSRSTGSPSAPTACLGGWARTSLDCSRRSCR
jgi:cardiolipin synthase